MAYWGFYWLLWGGRFTVCAAHSPPRSGRPHMCHKWCTVPSSMYPVPVVLTQARLWFRGQKCGNMGSPCLDKPVFGTRVAGIGQPDPSEHDNAKQHASTHPRTQGHMESQLHKHFATHIDPSCGRHNATNHILHLDWNRQNEGWKKGPKLRKHGITVCGQARVRTKGGGGMH